MKLNETSRVLSTFFINMRKDLARIKELISSEKMNEKNIEQYKKAIRDICNRWL